MTAAYLLRRARAIAGLSQIALAARAGTSQPAISRRERGDEHPTLDGLQSLLYACGVRLHVTLEPLPPSSRRETLLQQRREICELLKHYGASNPRIFGSVARGEDKDGSDVDLLIDLPKGQSGRSRILDVLALSDELSEATGLKIDVSTEDLLIPEIRQDALRDALAL